MSLSGWRILAVVVPKPRFSGCKTPVAEQRVGPWNTILCRCRPIVGPITYGRREKRADSHRQHMLRAGEPTSNVKSTRCRTGSQCSCLNTGSSNTVTSTSAGDESRCRVLHRLSRLSVMSLSRVASVVNTRSFVHYNRW